MKRVILFFLVIFCFASVICAADFVHPLDFRGTEKEKQKVLRFIKEDTKQRYEAIGMGDPATLRMMEKEELKAFKKLTKVRNRKLLDNVISTYSRIGLGNYGTILMMYEDQLSASQETLTW